LKRDVEVDVAIVGGGIIGATVAAAFAEVGVRVGLLEAALVGHGSTAASTALLMQEPDEHFVALEKRYGSAAATRIWELSRQATGDLVKRIRRLGIACDLVERDSIYYATNADAESLLVELRRRQAAGLGGRWLGADAVRRVTGLAGAQAILTTGNAQLDPYKACLGLLRSAQDRGAWIFERSAVRRIDTSRAGVTLITDTASMRAQRVIIATGYATREFKPLAGHFRMKHTYVLATSRIGLRVRRELGLSDVMLWDTARPYHYARWTKDHRLLLGGADRPVVPPRRRAAAFIEGTRILREYFEGLFPPLAGVAIDYAWEGLFAATPDGLPYIGPHRRYPKHLFALGYGGNGMTFGSLAARVLLDFFNGIASEDQSLFAFDRFRRPR
jgi:glycine/D-amino acid oxidase-like deaminating enzyme